MLASDFVPPNGFTVFAACALFVLVLCDKVIGVYRNLRGPEAHPPNDTLRATHDALADRVTRTEEQIAAIWNTFREEDEAIRREIRDSVKTIERSLGRLEGATNAMESLLKRLEEEK